MGKAKPFLFGSLLGASAMFVAMQYHVVRSHDGVQLVPRTPQASLGLAWADIREWDAARWTDRPELARALMAHGSGDLISQSVTANLVDSVSLESATLDQLRALLNKTTDAESRDSQELFKLPALNPLKNDQPGGTPGDQDVFTIPMPREAAKNSVADPFRVAQSAATPAGGIAPVPGNDQPGRSGSSSSDTAGGTAGGLDAAGVPGMSGSRSLTESPGFSNNTTAPGGVATPPVASQGRRFSVDDILDSGSGFFQEDVSPRTHDARAGGSGTIGNDRAGSAPSSPGRSSTFNQPSPISSTPTGTRQLADQMEESIFGSSGGPRGTPNPAPSDSGSGAVSGSPFEDISGELESRARSALSRAESALSGQPQPSPSPVAGSGGSFVRDRMGERDSLGSAPGSATSAPDSGGAASGTGLSEAALRSLREKFDPFVD